MRAALPGQVEAQGGPIGCLCLREVGAAAESFSALDPRTRQAWTVATSFPTTSISISIIRRHEKYTDWSLVPRITLRCLQEADDSTESMPNPE
jgi:hypothetical protein